MKLLIDRPDGRYCFRLHRDRVYYMSERLLKHATIVDRDKMISIGTCFGKFTKTKKFHLHITSLDYLAPYAQVISIAYVFLLENVIGTIIILVQYKIWLKPAAEQQFLLWKPHHEVRFGTDI